MKVVVFLYVFTFACLFNVQASTPPVPKSKIQALPTQQTQTHAQAQPKDCVKHPQIVKAMPASVAKVGAEKAKIATNDKVVKIIPIQKPLNTVPHFSVLNFINFFYTKDTLDNLHVM